MGNEQHLKFEPFRLDRANEQLWRGTQEIKLRPKAFAVLDHLLGHAGQLVTKNDLLEAVWPGTFVTDAVLKVTIRQLREALGDDPKIPRFIETLHRRGYRFVAPVADEANAPARGQQPDHKSPVSHPVPRIADPCRVVVGRDQALARIQRAYEKMLGGERQIVFVTGEAGIGKTALVDTFVHSIAGGGNVRLGRGQCLEQFGTGEAYLPVLEAMGRLCQEPELVEFLRAHAPMWLLQMPSLVTAADREILSRQMLGASRERMLREMGGALEAMTAERPLVLVLEDLHWSDFSTLDLISYLANQRQIGQLMLVGTFRTAELIVSGHPLKAVKQELTAKGQCDELSLDYLNEDSVAKYLSLRFPEHRMPLALAKLIHERTDGNPLFLVNAVDYLISEGSIQMVDGQWALAVAIENVDLGVPDSIKQMIEKQLDHLNDVEQRILEAASVAGREFSTDAVVAGSGEEMALVEARCDELVRKHQFIQEGEVQFLPSGEAVNRYAFTHSLYRKVLYERIPAARRNHFHRSIGRQAEAAYGDRAREIAAELAMHFERGADIKQAAKYLWLAADNAIRRFAYPETVALSRRGLKLLGKLPDSPERARRELCLLLSLGAPLITTVGFAAPEVGEVYQRARLLCRQLDEPHDVSDVLWGLWTFHTMRGELRTALAFADELLALSGRYPEMQMRAHSVMEITFVHLGRFVPALEHYERTLQPFNCQQDSEDGLFYAPASGVAMQCFSAWAYWFLGQADRAVAQTNDAIQRARELSDPLSLTHALYFASILYQLRRDAKLAQEHAEAALAVCREHGLALYPVMADVARAWALVAQGSPDGSVESIREGLAILKAGNAELVRPHYLGLLGETLSNEGHPEKGLAALDEGLALIALNGEGYYEAELYRLKGEVLLSLNDGNSSTEDKHISDAEAYFKRALGVAQKQNAKSWELRAAVSLARLLQSQHQGKEAQVLLARVYGGFTEGFATLDLQEAKTLLDQLSTGQSLANGG